MTRLPEFDSREDSREHFLLRCRDFLRIESVIYEKVENVPVALGSPIAWCLGGEMIEQAHMLRNESIKLTNPI